MFDKAIEQMDFNELRNAVQLLYDAYERMRRDNADAFANIGKDNFDGVFTKEYNSMKAQVTLSASAIKTMVSENALAEELLNYSTIEQTAGAISSYVQRSADLANAITVQSVNEMTDQSKTYKIQELSTNDNKTVISESYYYYNSLSKDWEKISGDSIYTVFKQDADGFLLRGNTIIDGATTITRNLVLSGNVTWKMDNSPVLSRYSSDNINWHSPMADNDIYMQMSFDGGNNWSNSTKVVGTDGKPGTNGTDATVTTQAVFDALTNEGAKQGLFSAFYKKENENKLFINAEYINTENLSSTRLYSKGRLNGYYAKISSAYGDFGIYSPDASDTDDPTAESCVWGIYKSDPANDVINFYSFGTNYFGHNNDQKKTYPKGTWDFSSCDVVGLDSTSVVAVFG